MATEKSFDDTIVEYQTLLAEKEAAFAKIESFKPRTNCSLTLHGQHYNIQTLQKDTLYLVIGQLQAMQDGLNKYFPDADLPVSGYPVKDWIKDLVGLVEKLTIRQRKGEIDHMKSQLNELLSEDAKKSLKMKALMDQMKNL